MTPGPDRGDRGDRVDARVIDPYRARRVRVLALLGFSSGLPLYLTGYTLTAWMPTAGVDLATIGVFSLVALPYTFKWAWAPLIDRYAWPFLGRRRGWLLVLQVALAATIAAMGLVDPLTQPAALAGLAVAVAFLSASQDIVVNAFTADSLGPDERAAGSALSISGYRTAMMATGFGGVALADVVPWSIIYGAGAALMAVGLAGTLLAAEPAPAAPRPPTLAAALWMPVWRLLRQRRIAITLGFVALVRFGDLLVPHLLFPFVSGLGFSLDEIAVSSQLVTFPAMIAGAALGGWLVPRLGLRRSLLWFGAAGAATNLGWALLDVAPSLPLFIGVAVVDAAASAAAGTAFVAFLLSRCEPDVSATQYALLTSVSSLAPRFLGFVGASIVINAGWTALWLATAVAVVPALFLVPLLALDDRSGPDATVVDLID